jgi:hypothetical protein
MEQNQNPENQLNIELTEEMAEGAYANLTFVTHSFAEFVVDFVNVMPNTAKAKVKSRIILTPQNAKRLMRVLIDNIKQYESVNGIIKDGEQQSQQIQFPVGGPIGQA